MTAFHSTLFPFRAVLRWSAVLLLALGLSACSDWTNPYYDAAKPHHRRDGFNNRFIDNWGPQPSFWRWTWEQWTTPELPQNAERIPRTTPHILTPAARDTAALTWLGHSTALWQVAGLNILTDPVFSDRASPFSFAGPRRATPLPLALKDLPRIDIVLISHNHYDHLDRATVTQLAAQPGGPPLFVVPLGIDLWMKDLGITKTKAMDWWDSFVHAAPHGDVTISFVPAQHWSSRTPWDRNRSLWGGFVVQTAAGAQPFSFYFTGDTGYSADFAEIGAKFGGFDVAMIPVGCYLPRWFMQRQHVNEDEAARIHRDVKSRFSVGVHWGVFRLCDDPVDSPIDGLPAARRAHGIPDDSFVLMALGETRTFPVAAAAPAQQPDPAR
jgi:L-ascorbate metabolism protein UlaG (beta-lactamase superfamily)